MYSGYATTKETFSFFKRLGAVKDFYSVADELFFSSIGIGTFKPEPHQEENYFYSFKDSVVEAVKNGVNHIDTGINYRYQKSEKEVGEALGELFESGVVKREELILSSKGGFLPLDYPFPENPYSWIEEMVIEKKLAKKEDIILDQYCIAPKYLEWSIEKSLVNLGVETLDIYYLSNPEMELGISDYRTVLKKIEKAFKVFEKKRAEGKIRSYGVALWNGLLNEVDHSEYVSILDLHKIAVKVGGENHGFKYLQMPYNLGKTNSLTYSNQKFTEGNYYPAQIVAKQLGINVIASSSLLQMKLFQAPFSQKVTDLLSDSTLSDIHYAIQFTRSSPFITSALFTSAQPEHIKNNLILNKVPKTDEISYKAILGVGNVV